MPNEKVSRFRTLADTSSVVAHDLCAQLHVIQFCLDELDQYVDSDGKEFLKRMGTSTNYITHLIDSYRRGLKVSLSDDQAHILSEIYDGFLELIKNHYFVVLEKINFEIQGNLGDFYIKNKGRKLMHQFFALYSFFIDELKANQDEEGSSIDFNFKVTKPNNRFALIRIEVKGVTYDKEWFKYKLEESVEEKGKMRQFLGVTLIREAIEESADFLTFSNSETSNIIELTVPLELNT